MKTHPTLSYFFHFVLFNLCFFCLQATLVFSQNGSFINTVSLPPIVYIELFVTLLIHLTLYILLSLLQTFLLLGVLKHLKYYFSIQHWQIIIWGLTACAILSANSYYFPLSVFSKLWSPPIPRSLILGLLAVSGFALALLFINSLFYSKKISLGATALLIFVFSIWNYTPSSGSLIKTHTEKPNVIILGIDSLAPENITSENMPFFSKLINSSTQFTDSISPLARTYPAWSSILTGLYPKHHHAEENLVPKSMVDNNASIAWVLKQQGYTPLYATDDRRFNNMDKEFGFKKIIGPKSGVNDIILGSYNDFPLTNLLINFPISSWLFPYNYSNRAGFFSYYPQTFNETLKKGLAPEEQNMPVFLAVHFTLPHWPYAWAQSLPEQVNNEFSLQKRTILYQQSLKKVDQQFHSFFTYLHQHHYLENSLLILLSDHGEVLYYPNSRPTNYHNYQGKPPSTFATYLNHKTATVLNKSAGHGSDILSPMQYHNVLAFRVYKHGRIITQHCRINTRTALIDLAPTILDFLHIKNNQKMDGISLLPSILNKTNRLPQRVFFIESGIFPNQSLSKQKAIQIGKLFYTVNPESGAIEIQAKKLNYFNRQKLYGIIQDDWILALYPNEKTYIAVIQNTSSGIWSDDLHSVFAKSTPADAMYRQLQQFYKRKLFLPLP